MMLPIPTEEEFIGNQAALLKLEDCVRNKKPCLLVGPPGVGKTSSVYLIARKLGCSVVEVNASDERKAEDLKRLVERAKMKTLGLGVIYLVDEADGASQSLLIELVEKAKNPVVLTANEGWRLDRVKERAEVIEFRPPSLEEVVKGVKKLVPNGDFQGVSTDVRNSIISATVGADRYEESDVFEQVAKIFQGTPPKKVDVKLLLWLAESITENYQAMDVREAYRVLEIADLCLRPEVLGCLKKVRKPRVKFPRLLRVRG